MRIASLFLILLLLAPAACRDAPEAESSAVTVEDFQYARLPGGGRIVTGRLMNPGAEAIENAQIQIALYDGDNRFVATMSVIVQGIPPGEAKAFREPVTADETVERARVRGVLVL